MSKGEKRLFAWALCLTVGALVLSQLKFLSPWAAYQKNRAAFAFSSAQLETLLGELKGSVPWEERTAPHFELWLREGQPPSLTVGGQLWEPGPSPALTEPGAALCQAGVFHIDVYDFSGEENGQGSPCEVWYSMSKGHLVYSASGFLPHSHDPGNPDWGGYRFYEKRLGKHWFVAVSRYDRDSLYWKM